MIANILLPAGLAFIMFALGLTLQVSDFSNVAKRPWAITLGLFCQLLLLPLFAFVLLHLWPVEPLLAVGIMVLAACPGGITSNLLTHYARGDTALSISMTAISSLAGMLTIPLIVGLSLTYFLNTSAPEQLPVWRMILGIFTVSTLPVLFGIAINRTSPAIARKIRTVAQPASTVIFIAIVIAAFKAEWREVMAAIPAIGLPLFALNFSVMVTGYVLAISTGLEPKSARAISLEGGLQNGAVGIFVASSLIANSTLAVASITYALVMNITAAVFILVLLVARPNMS